MGTTRGRSKQRRRITFCHIAADSITLNICRSFYSTAVMRYEVRPLVWTVQRYRILPCTSLYYLILGRLRTPTEVVRVSILQNMNVTELALIGDWRVGIWGSNIGLRRSNRDFSDAFARLSRTSLSRPVLLHCCWYPIAITYWCFDYNNLVSSVVDEMWMEVERG